MSTSTAIFPTTTMILISAILQGIYSHDVQSMEAVTYSNTSIQIINTNRDFEISITEENDEILEGFTLNARRK